MNWQENCIAECAPAGWPVHAEAMKELAWKFLFIYLELHWYGKWLPKTDICLKISADIDTDVMVNPFLPGASLKRSKTGSASSNF